MKTLIAYLRLVRIPNVFTVPGDPLAGAAVATWALMQAGAPATPMGAMSAGWRAPFLCALAGSLIYLAGMAFNDIFDAEEDRRERPERPIPSGQVSVGGAGVLGLLLHAGGLAAAWTASPAAGKCAVALVVATFAYNGALKSGPLGATAMGLCRALNLLMGAFAVGWSPRPAGTLQEAAPLLAAFLLLAYVVAITRTAEGEVSGLDATAAGRALERFLVIVAAGIGLAALGGLPGSIWGIAPLVVLVYLLGRAAARLAKDPRGPNVGGMIKASVFGIVLFDDALLFAVEAWPVDVALPLLLIPATILGRAFYST